jgi:hypothetical protein
MVGNGTSYNTLVQNIIDMYEFEIETANWKYAQ